MPPTKTSATGRQPATKNSSRGVKKNRKLAAIKRVTRSQVLHSSNPPVFISITPEPLQEPSAASSNLSDPPRPGGRKRRNDSEVERPGKRQDNRQFASESSQPLTKENLATLDRLTGSNPSDKMDHTTTTLEKSGRKRLVSRQSSIADLSQATTSAETVVSTYARYRWVDLHKAGISVRSEPLPKDVQTRINAVIQRETTAKRKEEVIAIAEYLCNEFVAVLNAARREDDSVEPLHHALSSMDKNAKFEFPRKIGIVPPLPLLAPVSFAHIVLDWDTSLKPELIQAPWNFSFLEKSNDNSDELIDSPSKRRQPDNTCDSPERPQSTMPLLPLPLQQPRKVKSIVKTPRPDITMGLRHSVVVESLKAQGLDEVDADLFLRYLQEQQTLCSDPSQQGTLMRFPLLVVEGKSYSTGKFVFEAQNQAAVSGSCMMKMQHQLAKLTELSAPESYEKKEPLAFSICTEGPHMELWAHYTTSQDGRRNYNMRILQTCHASLLPGVVDFLLVVDSVLSWACSEFLDDVTKQLALVENAARQHAA
ncbi:hypothetical protein MMC17_004297 [Xylographa soralifera]|nr:hypothetical protein [Xylographa soralifera]